MNLRKGDKVVITTGRAVNRGHEGVIMKVYPETNKVLVEGGNMAKRHQKARRQNEQAGIIDKDMPLHASNVMIICSNCGPTRIGYKIDDDGTKARICRKCGNEL